MVHLFPYDGSRLFRIETECRSINIFLLEGGYLGLGQQTARHELKLIGLSLVY